MKPRNKVFSRYKVTFLCTLVAVVFLVAIFVPQLLFPSTRSEEPPNSFGTGSGLVEQLTLEQLVMGADYIVVGTVTDMISQSDAQHGSINTLVTLSAEDWIKGSLEGQIVITLPGGEMNGKWLWVEDAPSFQLGERAVVFLEESEDTFTVVGGFQGKFSIDKNNMVSGKLPLTQFIEQLRDIAAKQ